MNPYFSVRSFFVEGYRILWCGVTSEKEVEMASVPQGRKDIRAAASAEPSDFLVCVVYCERSEEYALAKPAAFDKAAHAVTPLAVTRQNARNVYTCARATPPENRAHLGLIYFARGCIQRMDRSIQPIFSGCPAKARPTRR